MGRLTERMFDARNTLADNAEQVFELAGAVIVVFFATQIAFADCAGHFGEGVLVSAGALVRGCAALLMLALVCYVVVVLFWTEIAEGLGVYPVTAMTREERAAEAKRRLEERVG